MICRASSGPVAPHLGARIDLSSGIAAECLQSGKAQIADVQAKAQNDSSTIPDDARGLGVWSVIAFPILLRGEAKGVLEVFSLQPSAFGENGQRTLEVFRDHIQRSLERASMRREEDETSPEPVQKFAEDIKAGAEAAPVGVEISQQTKPKRRLDLLVLVFAVLLAGCAVMLALLAQRRLTVGAHASSPVVKAIRAKEEGPTASLTPATVHTYRDNAVVPNPPMKERASADGSLVVYQDGKEIFYLPPQKAASDSVGLIETSSGVSSAGNAQPTGGGRVEISSSPAIDDRVLKRVDPDYPQDAIGQHLEGTAVLAIKLEADGTIGNVEVIDGNPPFVNAAAAAVRQWRFKPDRAANGGEQSIRVVVAFKWPK